MLALFFLLERSVGVYRSLLLFVSAGQPAQEDLIMRLKRGVVA